MRFRVGRPQAQGFPERGARLVPAAQPLQGDGAVVVVTSRAGVQGQRPVLRRQRFFRAAQFQQRGAPVRQEIGVARRQPHGFAQVRLAGRRLPGGEQFQSVAGMHDGMARRQMGGAAEQRKRIAPPAELRRRPRQAGGQRQPARRDDQPAPARRRPRPFPRRPRQRDSQSDQREVAEAIRVLRQAQPHAAHHRRQQQQKP